MSHHVRKLINSYAWGGGQIHTYAWGLTVNGHFAFFVSRNLVTNQRLLFWSTTFVNKILAVLIVVSVCP